MYENSEFSQNKILKAGNKKIQSSRKYQGRNQAVKKESSMQNPL
jgi:hypothetical protein